MKQSDLFLYNWVVARVQRDDDGTVVPDPSQYTHQYKNWEDKEVRRGIQVLEARGIELVPEKCLLRQAGDDRAESNTLQCQECKRVFWGEHSFDAHRTGNFEKVEQEANGKVRIIQKNTRRCLTDSELQAKGLFYNEKTGCWARPYRGPTRDAEKGLSGVREKGPRGAIP